MEVIIDANFGMALGSGSAETLLEFSASAARKLKALQVEEGKPELMLRVSVYGGGCSGFQYTFSLDEEVNSTDKMVQKDGATLVIDQKSYQYLAGSEVDFSASTCGCGASFSI